MEFILLVGFVMLIGWLIDEAQKSQRRRRGGGSTRRYPPSSTTSYRGSSHPRTPTRSVREGKYYRPGASTTARKSNGVAFKDITGSVASSDFFDIKDLVDALTGARLDPSHGLYRCENCKVFYHPGSIEVIQAENNSKCVSCLQTSILPVTADKRGRNADVGAVTLQNYRQFAGRVITFEGLVLNVLQSRRGTDYAVMFENKPWVRGFKMVFFRGDVEKIGGPRYLYSMVGKRVRVRGLLINHETFGYEIIVSERGMILSVR